MPSTIQKKSTTKTRNSILYCPVFMPHNTYLSLFPNPPRVLGAAGRRRFAQCSEKASFLLLLILLFAHFGLALPDFSSIKPLLRQRRLRPVPSVEPYTDSKTLTSRQTSMHNHPSRVPRSQSFYSHRTTAILNVFVNSKAFHSLPGGAKKASDAMGSSSSMPVRRCSILSNRLGLQAAVYSV
ncbi:unnamed protein product [Protopolystoma xenopodis]|uniref:Uncharacterized protein n=1 Tax=Protopolystoma xenopodis TaxID=117903 RepID=A0A448XGD5_9PLAT|nr:unnamed protein product [Protopolystoma xenopodis]